MSQVRAPVGVAAARQRAERLFATYNAQSTLLLTSVFADGYADFIDTAIGSRLRPDDAADAVLRLNVSLWTVLRDIRSGNVSPRDFGKQSWDQVGAREIYAAGIQRLEADSIDYPAAAQQMRRDPLWQRSPVRIPGPNGPVELTFDNISSVWRRSVVSAVAPNETAEWIENDPVWQTIREGAVAAGHDPNLRLGNARASLATAHALFTSAGRMPRISNQVLPAIAAATGVNVIDEAQPAPAGASEDDLRDRVDRGDIDGFVRLENGRFITYSVKSPTAFAREVMDRVQSGALNHLGSEALGQIRTMLGPANNPGATLAQRLESEDSSRSWREFGGTVITLAAVGYIAIQTGGAAGAAFAEGAGGSGLAIAAAETLGSSVVFTTLMGTQTGDLSPERYAIDAAMFGTLRVAAPFSRLAGRLLPGTSVAARLARYGAVYGSTTVTAASVVTGFQVLEQTARGRSPRWRAMVQAFAHNLKVVAVLHGVNSALHRVGSHVRPGSPEATQVGELQARVVAANQRARTTLDELARETAKPANEIDADRVEALTERFNTTATEILEIENAAAQVIDRAVPSNAAPAVRQAFEAEAGRAGPLRTPRARHDVRTPLAEVTTPAGVRIEIPQASLEHALRAHTIENFDPVARLGELNAQQITDPAHVTSFFRTGSVTNAPEMATLAAQALRGRHAGNIGNGQRVLDLRIRGDRVRVVVGAGPGGQGVRMISIFPTNQARGLTRADIERYAQQIRSGQRTLDQARAEVAERFATGQRPGGTP